MKNHRRAGVLALAVASLVAARPTLAADDAAARAVLADRLLNDARGMARATGVPAELAPRQLLLTLKMARTLAPDSPDILAALAEAAQLARDRDIRKDALRQLIRLDPGHLVAQVELISEMAAGAQAIEEQMRVLGAALEKVELDPQVRSELALRLARLHLQRGENDKALDLLTQATKLNDMNFAAWQELVRLQSAAPLRVSDRMTTIVNCLLANPYQPDVWVAGGRALSASNQHDLAADWLSIAIDAASRAGTPTDGSVALEWAIEAAIAERRVEAEGVLRRLAALEDAPVPALLALLSVSGPSISATAPGEDAIVRKARDRVAASVKAAPDDKDLLADAAWTEVFFMPSAAPEAEEYLTGYKKLAGETDIYRRIEGFRLLRDGKLDEAAKLLSPLAAKDPWAGLGMARIATAGGDAKAAAAQLQDIWASHPTGLLALHTAAEARKHKVTLKDTTLGQATRAAAMSVPRAVYTASSAPRDVALLMPSLAKRKYAFGEPIVLTLKVANTTDRPLSVGPQGAVRTGIALSGAVRGANAQDVGFYALENAPRVYRLPARGGFTDTLRIDQGVVYDAFLGMPTKSFNLSLTLMTAPVPTRQGLLPGLGGQIVSAGELIREASPLASVDMPGLTKAAKDLPNLPPQRQMMEGAVLLQLLPEMKAEKFEGQPGAEGAKAARDEIVRALATVMASDVPAVRAWFLRVAPPQGLPEELTRAIQQAPESPHAVVRMLAAWRVFAEGRQIKDEAARGPFRERLKAFIAAEKDPDLREWGEILLKEVDLPLGTAPATAPATLPAATEKK